MSLKHLFVPIKKIDEEQRLVYGQVAAEVKDNSGEIFDYKSSKPYFEKWSANAHATSGGKSHGNLRVMHTSKVAGIVAQPLGFDDDACTISAVAHVVDDDEWKKVLTGCYTGFSMGGRYVERIKKGSEQRYTAEPVEISLVDKPCIPTAVFEVVKADGVVEERHFSEEVWDLEKAGGTQPRHPAGSNRGGQFSSKNGSGASAAMSSVHESAGGISYTRGEGETHRQAYDKAHAKAYQANAEKAREETKSWKTQNPSASTMDEVNHFRGREKHYDGERMKNYSKGRKEADARDKAERAEARAKKSDDGEKFMYEPTNDEMLAVARDLAKAAGKSPDDDWLDFMADAKAQIVAEKQAEADGLEKTDAPGADDLSKAADEGKGDDEVDPKLKIEGEAKEGDSEDDADDKGGEKGKKKGEKDKEAEEAAEKSDTPEVQQGWTAKDGTFFLKKADALAHNEALNKSDQPSVADTLAKMVSDAEKIANGEQIEAEPVVEKSDIEAMADQLDAIVAVQTVEKGDTPLAKGMYTVERTARLLRELASLNISVSQEAKREGDGSMLPGQIGIAVGQMGEVLIEMAKEEVEELMATVAADGKSVDGSPCYYDDYMALAAPVLGLEKAAVIEKATATLELRKVHTAPADDILAKMAEADQRTEQALAKAAAAEEELQKVVPLVHSLQEQFDKIKAMPRAAAPTTRVVTKGDDFAGIEGTTTSGPSSEVLSKFTPDQLADAAIRLSQQHGVTVGPR